jgi:hypothetical protein
LQTTSIDIISRKISAIPYQGSDGDHSDARPFLLHTIDLNRDGQADVAILENSTQAGTDDNQGWRYYYANINGHWWFTYFASYEAMMCD